MFIFQCPHCDLYITVDITQVNCRIFRHAFIRDTFVQLNPHAPKEMCDELSRRGLIYGCGKPLQFVFHPAGNYVEPCGYI